MYSVKSSFSSIHALSCDIFVCFVKLKRFQVLFSNMLAYLASAELVSKVQYFFGIREVGRIIRNPSNPKFIAVEVNERRPTDGNLILYKIEDQFWHRFFLLATELGHETFYIVFFTILLSSVSCTIGRHLYFLIALSSYIASSLKDIIRLERPSMPPCIHIAGCPKEYGMPSTHAMFTLVLSFGLWILVPYRMIFWISVVVTLSVSCSRLYLGLHSVAVRALSTTSQI